MKIKIGDKGSVIGLSIINYNNDIFLRSKGQLYLLEKGSFSRIAIDEHYSILDMSNMTVFKDNDEKNWLVIPVRNRDQKVDQLLFYSKNRIKFIDLPQSWSVADFSYFQQHNESLYTVLSNGGKISLFQFSGTSFDKIVLPEGFSYPINPSEIPAFYPAFNILGFHLGIHMVLKDVESDQLTPFTYKYVNNEFIFEQWKGEEKRSVMPGTNLVSFLAKNTIVSYQYLLPNKSAGMYQHVAPPVFQKEIKLPAETTIAQGYPSVAIDGVLIVYLNNGNNVDLYQYKNESFTKISLDDWIYLNQYSSIIHKDSSIIVIASDDTSDYLLSIRIPSK